MTPDQKILPRRDRAGRSHRTISYPSSLVGPRVTHSRRRIGTKGDATWDAAQGRSAGAALLDWIARNQGSQKAALVELRV